MRAVLEGRENSASATSFRLKPEATHQVILFGAVFLFDSGICTRCSMAYIVLGQFTDQGIKNVADTIKRAEKLREMGQKAGAAITEVYWTLGHYDIARSSRRRTMRR
jgi:hypothetical protein